MEVRLQCTAAAHRHLWNLGCMRSQNSCQGEEYLADQTSEFLRSIYNIHPTVQVESRGIRIMTKAAYWSPPISFVVLIVVSIILIIIHAIVPIKLYAIMRFLLRPCYLIHIPLLVLSVYLEPDPNTKELKSLRLGTITQNPGVQSLHLQK